MRNIHILATDKPSSLFEIDGHFIIETGQLIHPKNYRCIYITSDEEVTSNCWCLNTKNNSVYKTYKGEGFNEKDKNNDWKKITFTTDNLLTKDGVQAIDDEFLEWFVKNPSCEFVEVVKKAISDHKKRLAFYKYKIIIPKKEPKQVGDITEKGVIDTIGNCANCGIEFHIHKEVKNICIQTGLPCGVQCLSEDACNRAEQDKKLYSEEAFNILKKVFEWYINDTPYNFNTEMLRSKFEQFKNK